MFLMASFLIVSLQLEPTAYLLKSTPILAVCMFCNILIARLLPVSGLMRLLDYPIYHHRRSLTLHSQSYQITWLLKCLTRLRFQCLVYVLQLRLFSCIDFLSCDLFCQPCNHYLCLMCTVKVFLRQFYYS